MLVARYLLLSFALMFTFTYPGLCAEQDFKNGEDHIFSVGEILHVSVLDEQQLSNEYQVDDTGMILMPLIGKVHVAGLDASEIEHLITDHLKDGYLWDPIVSVYATHKKGFYILGAVQNPGHYVMPENRFNILKAVAVAGGYTRKAIKNEFEIVRGHNNIKYSLEGDASAAHLNPGDVIIIKERFF